MRPLCLSGFNKTLIAIAFAVVISGFLFGSVASAQVVIDNIVDSSLRRYDIHFTRAGQVIGQYALSTFMLLATVELCWGMIRVYINNGGLQGLLSEIVKRIMFIGFFLFLLQRGTTTINEILRSFDSLVSRTGIADGSLSPGGIFDKGQELFARMYDQATSIGVLDIVFDGDVGITTPVLLLFIGMFAMIVMVIIAAHFGVVLLETFIAANAGLIFLAFGGSRWTHKYAVSYIKYGLSVGMKLFVLSIIVGLTASEINHFLQATDIGNMSNAIAMVSFLLFSMVVSIIAPKSVKSMMDGVSVASGASISNAMQSSIRTTSRTTGKISRSVIPK